MRYCKLRAEEGNKIVPIIKEDFESATGFQPPYYQGENKQAYAICTYCENPVVIVGFYSKHGKYAPHLRHTKTKLQDMPKYSQLSYDLCIYAKPQRYKKEDRKPKSKDYLSKEIRRRLLDNFDKVVYFLEKETGLIFSDDTLKNMLNDYLAMDGTNYIGATLDNYAWIFLYLSLNKTLYGHIIKSDSWIHKILKKYCKNIYFEPISDKSTKLLTTRYTRVNYAFLGHSTIPKNGSATERLKFVLWQDDVEIYSKEILIDTEYFFNIVNFETWKSNPRGQRHLAISDLFR